MHANGTAKCCVCGFKAQVFTFVVSSFCRMFCFGLVYKSFKPTKTTVTVDAHPTHASLYYTADYVKFYNSVFTCEKWFHFSHINMNLST